jgi:NitT/TauT family transport system permease protein
VTSAPLDASQSQPTRLPSTPATPHAPSMPFAPAVPSAAIVAVPGIAPVTVLDDDIPVARAERKLLGISTAMWPRIIAPVVLGVAFLALWTIVVRVRGIPPYILPDPILVAKTLVSDWPSLSSSLWITLSISLAALTAAVVVGLSLAILFTQSKWLELSLFPYAIALQVTPIVAIAPLIIIWANNVTVSLLICAWLVAFFPILSNTTLGLNSADHNLVDLFQLYRASRAQTLWNLRLPAAMPYFLGGLRISGGLSLIGAVVAEFVAGTGGTASGLAYRILESGYQLKIPRMFAALTLVSLCGVAIFVGLSLVSYFSLRHWHASAARREN